MENNQQGKSKLATMLLCLFLGNLGVHRFYLGKIGTGILWLLTGGCCGIGAIVDFFKICFNKVTDKDGNELVEDISFEASRVFAIVVGVLLSITVLSLIASFAFMLFMFANVKAELHASNIEVPSISEIIEESHEAFSGDIYSELEAQINEDLIDMPVLVD